MRLFPPFGSMKVVCDELLPPGTIVAMRGAEVLDIITPQMRDFAKDMKVSLELPMETDKVSLSDDLYQQLMTLVENAGA